MSKQQTPADSSTARPDFESALEELEALVAALEAGDLGLAESLDRFKRGIELSKQCHQMLDEARQSVEILTRPEDESSAQTFNQADD